MAYDPARHSGPGKVSSLPGRVFHRNRMAFRRYILFAAVAVLCPLILAQSNPQVTGVDPSAGKVNDSLALAGENLGKGSVSAVFLSNDKEDFKATIVEQTPEKIVVKVPQVKSGIYNVSIQVGDKLLIKPIRFTVQE
jgi:hypothetical protein